jgi:5-formyltetrahydrofolate cyclo-ligase
MTDHGPRAEAARKAELRRLLRARVGTLGRATRLQADAAICRELGNLAGTGAFDAVLGYLSMTDEVRIDAFLAKAVETGLRVLLPRSDGSLLRWIRWQPATILQRDANGVLAPGGVTEATGDRLLVVTPGRAFDRRGVRLGRGRGYYDRTLSSLAEDAVVAGVAYDCQVLDVIPEEQHDHRVDLLITEKERLRAGSWEHARNREES